MKYKTNIRSLPLFENFHEKKIGVHVLYFFHLFQSAGYNETCIKSYYN